jgi:hypothetical protein
MLRGLSSCAPAAFFAANAALVRSFGERGVEVQHERIGIPAELDDDERHALCHQPRDERYIPGQPVELGNDYAAFSPSGRQPRPRRAKDLGSSKARTVAIECSAEPQVISPAETSDWKSRMRRHEAATCWKSHNLVAALIRPTARRYRATLIDAYWSVLAQGCPSCGFDRTRSPSCYSNP